MKKNLFMVAAVALFATVSCNKENIDNNGVQGDELSDVVFVAQAEQTKTALGEAVGETRPVTWVSGDEITVNGVKFTTADNGAVASFTTTDTFAEADIYTAIYPASAGTSLTAVNIPAEQNGTFASAAVSVAASVNQVLGFKNVASILKFKVPSPCSTITIESTATLAGEVNVTFDDDNNPKINSVSAASSKKITLTGSFVAGTDYYVAVLPGSHKFTIRLDGYLSKASTTAVTTKRAVITNLQTLPELETFSWGMVGQHQGWNITAPTPMYKVSDKVYGKLNIKLQSNGFKFAKSGLQNWNTSNTHFGAWRDSGSGYFNFSTEMSVGDWYSVYTNNLGGDSQNIGVSDFNKSYDVYVKIIQDADWGQELGYTVVEHGTAVAF